MGVKDDKKDQNDRRETRSRNKNKMSDSSKDSASPSKDTKNDTTNNKNNPDKKHKKSPKGVTKRKGRPKKNLEEALPEKTLSFILPIMDGMFPPEMMIGGPSKKKPAVKGKRSKAKSIDNPAEESYDRAHAHYYMRLHKDEQAEIAKREKEVYDLNISSNVPLRFRIINSNMPPKTKGLVLQKADGLLSGDPFCSEKSKLQKWMEIVLRIPFGIVKPPPVTRDSPVNEIQAYIRKTEHNLDTYVYGHSEAKEQIIQTLAKWISNPTSKGNVLGLHGPPGVGKSTLVKHIGDALGTPTVTIPLGGASDGSFLDGHSYVYEGSLPGIMVSSVSKSGCMNPVILLDELDKVSESPKGAEILNILIHLTDPVQNNAFRDKYLGDVEMDLSQAVFVFTFNDVTAIHPILKDRMLCIETKAYTFSEKYEIAKRHLLPRICKDHGFREDQFVLTEDTLRDIMNRIDSESGVRNMNRALEAIVSQVNFDRLVGKIETSDRIVITEDMIKENIKPKHVNASVSHLYL